jgi:hypothetical protein
VSEPTLKNGIPQSRSVPVSDENGKLFVKSPSYLVLEESSRILERWFGRVQIHGKGGISDLPHPASVLLPGTQTCLNLLP